MVRILASLMPLVMAVGLAAAETLEEQQRRTMHETACFLGTADSSRCPPNTPAPLASPQRKNVVGAFSIGEFTIGNNFLWGWVYPDAANDHDARTKAHRMCSTQQTIPGSTGTWLPQACTEVTFADAASFVAWVDRGGRPQRTIVYVDAKVERTIDAAIKTTCNTVPYGTAYRVFWGRNSHAPYPAHWDQSQANATWGYYGGDCY